MIPHCSTELSIARPSRQFQAGEQVTGHVLLSPETDIKAKWLKTQLIWVCRGKNGQTEREVDVDLHPIDLMTAGETHRFGFGHTLPAAPISFSGTHIEVQWELRAALETPWGISEPSSVALIVRSAPPSPSTETEQTDAADIIPAEVSWFSWVRAVAGVLMLIVGCIPPADTLLTVLTGAAAIDEIGLYFTVNAVALFLCAAGLMAVKATYIQWRHQGITYQVLTAPAHPGQSVRIRIRFRPMQRLPQTNVRMLLMFEEIDSSPSERRDYRIQENICDRASHALTAETDAEVALVLPPDAIPSFSCEAGQLQWSVVVITGSGRYRQRKVLSMKVV